MITGGEIATVGIAGEDMNVPEGYLVPAWAEGEDVHPDWKQFVSSVFPNLDETVLFMDPERDLMFVPLRFVELV